MAFLSEQGKNGELWVFKPEEKVSSWRNDFQSLVKKCRILALYFFPQLSNRCRVSEQRGYIVHVDRCIRWTNRCRVSDQRWRSETIGGRWYVNCHTLSSLYGVLKLLVWEKKLAAIKLEKSFVDPGGFWLSYQDPLHSERGKCIFPLK
jgi:hypothetical protein